MDKIAFLFAGQGAQYPGMGRELYDRFKSAREIFDMAESLRPGTKAQCFGLSDNTAGEAAAELNFTINAQPCLFAMDLACAKVLNENGIYAQGAAGFSLGEIPAIAYSGILSCEEAFLFVRKRAEYMSDCSQNNKGCMFAVLGVSAKQAEDICRELKNAYPVNFNCPGQTVVSCVEEVGDELIGRVTLAGGKAVRLSVSGAFHSPFMDQASERIFEYLKDKTFGKANIPVYSNYTAEQYENPAEYLSRQVNHPVLWQRTVENMIRDGFTAFIEVGAGKTLSGMLKRISAQVKLFNVENAETLDTALKAFIGG